MTKILISLLAEFWKPISTFFGGVFIYFKGRSDQKKADKSKKVNAELEAHKRLRDVQTNTNRDTALDRLHKSGDVRED